MKKKEEFKDEYEDVAPRGQTSYKRKLSESGEILLMRLPPLCWTEVNTTIIFQ